MSQNKTHLYLSRDPLLKGKALPPPITLWREHAPSRPIRGGRWTNARGQTRDVDAGTVIPKGLIPAVDAWDDAIAPGTMLGPFQWNADGSALVPIVTAYTATPCLADVTFYYCDSAASRKMLAAFLGSINAANPNLVFKARGTIAVVNRGSAKDPIWVGVPWAEFLRNHDVSQELFDAHPDAGDEDDAEEPEAEDEEPYAEL